MVAGWLEAGRETTREENNNVWMPDQSTPDFVSGGGEELSGVLERPPQHQREQPGMFGGRPRDTVLFRLRTNSGQTFNCRFEGTLSGMLDQGDTVRVSGTSAGGVIEVSRIVDSNGAVIAQSQCFVATAALADPMAPEVRQLRAFRDRVLRRCLIGRAAIALYWRVGPVLAEWIAPRPRICRAVRAFILWPLCRLLPADSSREPASTCRGITPAEIVSGEGETEIADYIADRCGDEVARNYQLRERPAPKNQPGRISIWNPEDNGR